MSDFQNHDHLSHPLTIGQQNYIPTVVGLGVTAALKYLIIIIQLYPPCTLGDQMFPIS